MAERLGHRVTSAAGFEDALPHLRDRTRYDALLVDVHLDEAHTGFDLFEALRLEGRGLDQHVVFTTGDSISPRTRDALQRFLDRRPSDPEGLYLMGRAHAGMGHGREAVEWMQRCVEAVRTAPAYKYRADKRWLNEAQQFLRTQA